MADESVSGASKQYGIGKFRHFHIVKLFILNVVNKRFPFDMRYFLLFERRKNEKKKIAYRFGSANELDLLLSFCFQLFSQLNILIFGLIVIFILF